MSQKLRRHAFLTSRGLEYRECGEWKVEEFNASNYEHPACPLDADPLYARLWSENRAIWILNEEVAYKLRLPLSWTTRRYDVARNSVREIDAEENRIHKSGDTDADRAMSERISFKPKSASEQTKDCCLLFPDKADNWGFSEEDQPEVIERALDSLQAEFGRSLVYPPGRLAIYLMERSRDRAKEQVNYKKPPASGFDMWRIEGFDDWKSLRPLKPGESDMRYIHAFDKNAAFLQCVGIPLGVGNYRHARRPLAIFDQQGVWRVKSQPYFGNRAWEPWQLVTRGVPESFNPPGLRGSLPFSQWVTTPTLKLLCELDLVTDIEEAWLADDSHKLFPSYYSLIKRGSVAAQESALLSPDGAGLKAAELVRQLVKRIYVKGIGYLHSEFFKEEWFYRPDWWATIVSEAAARIFRDAIEVKRECDAWPVATLIDCLYYVSDHPDWREAFPIFNGRFSNKFKHKGTAPLTPDLASAAERGLRPGEFGGLFKQAVSAYEKGEI